MFMCQQRYFYSSESTCVLTLCLITIQTSFSFQNVYLAANRKLCYCYGSDILNTNIEFGEGKHILCVYKELKDHPDPLFSELTYGECGHRSAMVKNNVKEGSHYFFHTTIEGQRYITAHYFVSETKEGSVARHDKEIRNNYKNVHIHPEEYPLWWGEDYDANKKDNSRDVIIFGDKGKSLGKLETPVLFDRKLAEKREFEGNRIMFDTIDKNGHNRTINECISSATRVPRYITKNDVITLFTEINNVGN